MKPIDGKYPFGPYGVFPAFEMPLSDDQLLCLGKIAVVQGQIEYLLGRIFEELAQIDGRKIPVRKSATLGQLVDELGKHALDGLAPELADKVKTLHEKLSPLKERRNELVKSIYGYQYEGLGKGLMLRGRPLNGMGSLMIYLGDAPGNLGKDISVAAYRNNKELSRSGVDDLETMLTQFILCSQGAGYIYGRLHLPTGFTIWDTWPFG